MRKTQLIKWGLKQSPPIYTLNAIAERLGVTRNVLINWMEARHVSVEKLTLIEEGLRR
jgi:transcriptional regulator with XRE-family HTH domain